MHVVEMADDGQLDFRAHPDAFAEIDRERAMEALGGADITTGEGCLRLALLVRSGALSTAVDGSDDSRKLLAALRGIRVARKLRRAAPMERGR
jgi:hypothetical protein